ncbi:MAG: T9SS type A sorting domain-containing protein [Phycisphaerae bacterium]|nr:T9SS type A sorting domain-containing protein [Saprospiraceae bacterium]
MKKTICLLQVLTLTVFTICAQDKHDYIWTIGYGQVSVGSNGTHFGGILMDFKDEPLSFTPQSYIIDRPKASIADKEGHLVAYADGCRILNRNHKIMLNGDSISPGVVFNEFCGQTNYPSWQGCIFLPKPGSDNLYYLFHTRHDDASWAPMNLFYSVIDASGDNGNGRVISKNNVLVNDSLFLGDQVSATRHANGRDWWLVSPRCNSNSIHVSLLTETGVEYKGIQDFDQIGWPVDFQYWSSQSAFSPDGSKYFHNSLSCLSAFDFDRCTGAMSNPIRLGWDSLPFAGNGVSVSPNSRYLYLTSGIRVQQYDLWAPNLSASMVVVAEYDSTLAPFPATFFQMTNGPDGKIYINTKADNQVLHIIQHPNEPGLACDVEQHAIWLPSLSSVLMPNFPNYRLGALEGPCDTIVSGVGSLLPSNAQSFRLFPNPNVGTFTVEMLGQSANGGGDGEIDFILYDGLGQLVAREQADFRTGNMVKVFEYGELPAGLYTLAIQNGKEVKFAKVVVQR